jgi:hypothetical protein
LAPRPADDPWLGRGRDFGRERFGSSGSESSFQKEFPLSDAQSLCLLTLSATLFVSDLKGFPEVDIFQNPNNFLSSPILAHGLSLNIKTESSQIAFILVIHLKCSKNRVYSMNIIGFNENLLKEHANNIFINFSMVSEGHL